MFLCHIQILSNLFVNNCQEIKNSAGFNSRSENMKEKGSKHNILTFSISLLLLNFEFQYEIRPYFQMQMIKREWQW